MDDQFVDYVKVCGNTVAEFRQENGETFIIDYRNCLSRLKDLKKNGYLFDQTKKAIDNWPKMVK